MSGRHKTVNWKDKGIRFVKRLILASCIGILCSGAVFSQEVPTNIKLPVDLRFQNAPGIKEYPQAHALLLQDEIAFRAAQDGTNEFDEHDVIKVLSDRGVFQHKEVSRVYRSDLETVEVKRARTILPDGRVLEIPKQAIVDEPMFPDSKAYKNLRHLQINYPGVKPNGIVEFHIVTKRKASNNNKWWAVTYVQNPEPLIESTFDVRVPQGSKLNWATPGLNNRAPEVSIDGSWDRYFWKVRQLPPFEGEPFAPSALQTMQRIEITNFENWSELRQWFDKGWSAATESNDKITQITQGLYAPDADPETRLKAIANWFSKKKSITYSSEDLQVRPASEVFQEEALAPLDAGALAATMLNVAGIKVQPVLLCGAPADKMIGQLPRANRVGEVALKVTLPNKSYWLDCDHLSEIQDSPPAGYSGLAGIVGDSETSIFQDMPVGQSDTNRKDSRIEARLDKNGKAEVLLSITESGKSGLVFREAGRELLESGKDAREQLLERLFEKIARNFSPRARVHDRYFALATKPGEPFDLSTTLSVPGFATLDNDKVRVPLPIQPNDVLANLATLSGPRTQPIHIAYPQREETRLHLILPPGSQMLDLPPAVQYDSPWGSFFSTTRIDGSQVYYYSRLNLTQTWVSTDKIDEFVAFAKKVTAAQTAVLQYRSGTTASTPAPANQP